MKKVLAGVVSAFALLVAPAAASAHTITPVVDCVQKTQYGYVAHFTYAASSLGSDGEFIPAGRDTTQEKNTLSIGGTTQGAGQQAWIEQFWDGSNEYGFQVYFRADKSVTWTLKHRDMALPKSATATKDSVPCPGGGEGTPGQPGPAGPVGPPGPTGPTGPAGPEGPAGEPGADGQDGQDGASGATGATGAAGQDGASGSNGRDGKDGKSPSRCQSNRKFVLNIWADRGDKVRDLKAQMRGKDLKIKRISHRHWQVKFSMKGFRRGVYGVRVSATVNGKPERAVHIYRACYGKGTGLNASTIVRL